MKQQKSLKQLLYEYYNIEITKHHYLAIQKYVREFELRPSHIETLNTALLGNSKMYFLPKDSEALFNIFNIDIKKFQSIVHTASSIDTTRRVTSDPFNLFIVWLCHQTRMSKLPNKNKTELQVLLIKMLHYKFFTSTVNHMLPHGADEGTMRYTIDHLSNKHYIKQHKTSTWGSVIAYRARNVVDDKSIHYHHLQSFHPDEKILFVITDIHSRIRRQLISIIMKFHSDKEKGNSVISSAMVGEIGGDKVIREISSSLDTMAMKVCNSCLNLNEFIDHEMLNIAIVLTKNVKSDVLSSFLTQFSDLAVRQQKKGDAELTKGRGDNELLLGYRILVTNIIQKTYRECILDKEVDVSKKLGILNKTRDLYRSSRIQNRDILIIKNSVEALVNKYSKSSRSSTNASLRISFITYFILLSFKYL